MREYLLPILIGANIPLYWLFWKTYFKSWDGFVECLRLCMTPDIINAFRGEGGEARVSHFTLLWFLFSCAAAPLAEWGLIMKFCYSDWPPVAGRRGGGTIASCVLASNLTGRQARENSVPGH
jgi:hypothetical protein